MNRCLISWMTQRTMIHHQFTSSASSSITSRRNETGMVDTDPSLTARCLYRARPQHDFCPLIRKYRISTLPTIFHITSADACAVYRQAGDVGRSIAAYWWARCSKFPLPSGINLVVSKFDLSPWYWWTVCCNDSRISCAARYWDNRRDTCHRRLRHTDYVTDDVTASWEFPGWAPVSEGHVACSK